MSLRIDDQTHCTACGGHKRGDRNSPAQKQGWRFFLRGGAQVCAACYLDPTAPALVQSVYGGPHVGSTKGPLVHGPSNPDALGVRHV